VISTGDLHAILIDEAAGACGEPSTSGEHLVLFFCDAPAPGTYPIVGAGTFACPGSNAAALVEEGGGADVAGASGGSVQIDSAGPCTVGSFTAGFGPFTISGTFGAITCP
jgi:hypothetical protein